MKREHGRAKGDRLLFLREQLEQSNSRRMKAGDDAWSPRGEAYLAPSPTTDKAISPYTNPHMTSLARNGLKLRFIMSTYDILGR
jgi:hypothetical protein